MSAVAAGLIVAGVALNGLAAACGKPTICMGVRSLAHTEMLAGRCAIAAAGAVLYASTVRHLNNPDKAPVR